VSTQGYVAAIGKGIGPSAKAFPRTLAQDYGGRERQFVAEDAKEANVQGCRLTTRTVNLPNLKPVYRRYTIVGEANTT
jgi:hypothetical protein